jgi:putative transcriptional regulator
VHVLQYNGDSGKGGFYKMPIVYEKLFALLKEKGYSTYRIRQEKLIGQGTLTAIKNGTGGLDAKTIARLCEVLDCQPGDLMEYVKEPKEEE